MLTIVPQPIHNNLSSSGIKSDAIFTKHASISIEEGSDYSGIKNEDGIFCIILLFLIYCIYTY